MTGLVPLALALASSVLWGTADYWGGVLSRRIDSMRVVLWSQGGSLAVLVVVALVLGVDPHWRLAGYGAIAGAFGAVGLSCFYRGLALGSMSLVTPASALGVVVPVAVSLFRGEVPGPGAAIGVVLALVGIGAMSTPPGTATDREVRDARSSVLWGLAAAGCFGAFMTGLDASLDAVGGHGAGAVLWLGMGARTGSVLALLPITAVVARTLAPPPRRLAGPVVVVGLLDSSANMLYAAATVEGLLAVVAVLGNLYPAVTVLCARVLLGERLSRRQDAGIALAVVGVALVASS